MQGEEFSVGKAKDLLLQVIKEEIINHELTITAMLKLARILVAEFVTTGMSNLLDEVNTLLESVLDLASREFLHGIELLTQLIQVKVTLLKYQLNKAREMLEKIHSSATERGFNALALECEQEQDKLMRYSSMEKILALHEEEQIKLQNQHIEDIFDYLKEEAFRLTATSSRT